MEDITGHNVLIQLNQLQWLNAQFGAIEAKGMQKASRLLPDASIMG